MLTKTKEKTELKSSLKAEISNLKPELLTIEAEHISNMFITASGLLESSKNYLNQINVFPVADGDTGTNMSHTLKSVVNKLKVRKFKSRTDLFDCIQKTAIMESRGNSGTLLAGFISGFCDILNHKNLEIDAQALSEAFKNGLISSSNTVSQPKKGTILDVLEAFSKSFEVEITKQTDLTKIWSKSLVEAKISLEKTRNILPETKKAKVVDSGAAGMYVILDGMQQGLNLNQTKVLHQVLDETDIGQTEELEYEFDDLEYNYCTEIVMEADAESVLSLKIKLPNYGDSIQIIELDGAVKIHIHSNNPEELKFLALDHGNLKSFKAEDMTLMRAEWQYNRHHNLSSTLQNINNNSPVKGLYKTKYSYQNNGNKEKLLIITDTSADIPESILKSYPILQIPIPVFEDKNPEHDLQDTLSQNEFYNRMEVEPDFVPKTSKISHGKFIETYRQALDMAENILVLPISSGLSGTFESAIKAKEDVKTNRIHILDSQTASTGLTFKIKYAFDNYNQGKDLDNILNGLVRMRSKIKALFSVDNVKYLERGGRVSKSKSFIAQLLHISPVLTLKDGKIQPTKDKVYFSNDEKIASIYNKKIIDHYNEFGLKDIMLVYAGKSGLHKAQLIQNYILDNTDFSIPNEHIIPLTPVIGAHVGPGAIGVLFY